MKTSQAGIDLIKAFESLHDGNPKTSLVEPMLDPVGIPTIGYGCTIYPDGKRVTLDDEAITLEQCDDLLSHSLAEAEGYVNSLVTVPLTQNQFDALVSLVYNIGGANFKSSTLLAKLNAKCYSCAAEQFPRWNLSHGKVLKGLTNRRFQEKILFLS